MDRRTLLAAAGSTFAALAGCLASGDAGEGGSEAGSDPDPTDGYPPAFDNPPAAPTADPSSFETTDVDGISVPMAPIDVVHAWYRRREARFADARSGTEFDRSHIFGAVLSPAPDGLNDDPIEAWPKSDRIVTYCGCPTHLSSMRAASLIAGGYERVYIIREGFWTWHGRGYPMAGREVETAPPLWVLQGRVAPAFAGETAWARHHPSAQQEAGAIAADGTFNLDVRFTGVTGASVVEVETPAFRVAAPLAELSTGLVEG